MKKEVARKSEFKVSVVIPCWNGRKLLQKFLPSVLKIGADELVVVDDASADGSAELVRNKFPEVKLIQHEKNLGFGKSSNDGVRKAGGEIIILLNQDVLPEVNILDFVLPLFDDEKVFAVTFHESQWGWGKLVWKNGFLEHSPGNQPNKPHFSAWANGGSAAFRKSAWNELNGFDQIFHPFYWEDIDLSYRAWKRGYKVIWEPKARVIHEHEAAIGTHFSRNYINFISQRNQLIFIWKNITDGKLLVEHWQHLARRILKSPGYLKVFLAAFIKLPRIISLREQVKIYQKLTDKEIFSKFQKS